MAGGRQPPGKKQEQRGQGVLQTRHRLVAALSAYRWSADGYVEVLVTERGERVRAEPFDAIELSVGVFFGDDPDD